MLYRFTDTDGREIHFTAVPHTSGGTRLMLTIYRRETAGRAIISTCIDLTADEASHLAGSIQPVGGRS